DKQPSERDRWSPTGFNRSTPPTHIGVTRGWRQLIGHHPDAGATATAKSAASGKVCSSTKSSGSGPHGILEPPPPSPKQDGGLRRKPSHGHIHKRGARRTFSRVVCTCREPSRRRVEHWLVHNRVYR
ncbi:TPA: hypothetical protein N0F65_003726, partial [Lagenidium giganteum]